MQLDFYQVDSFTDKPYRGNPAAVIVMDGAADEEWMQNVAMEMNLSETSFLYSIGENNYNLRWFTPGVEADLCGHATLAAAHILWEKEFVKKSDSIKFQTKSGELSCKTAKGLIEMDFPEEVPWEISPPQDLLNGIGVKPLFVGKNRMDYFVELVSETAVRELSPDFGLIKKIDTRGVIVTAKSDNPEFDFASRFFAPTCDVNEDPVTGSAHCALAPYWAKKFDKKELKAIQLSKRQGVLNLKVERHRVKISGSAVTVLEGRILYC